MLIFTGTPYQIAWKQKIHQVLLLNELGPALPYELRYAGSKSGYSFGYAQWDLAAKATIHNTTFLDILRNTTNGSGQYIIDDSNPNTGRANDSLIQTLMDLVAQAGGNSLTTLQRDLINQALSSAYGQNAIDQRHDQYLGEVLVHVDNIIASVGDPQDRAFLETDIPKIFLADYHNQFDIGLNGPLHNFVRGQSTTVGGGSVRKVGRLGVDDLLNFYFSTKYAIETTAGLNDELRRFGNIVSLNGGSITLPTDEAARDEEAKGLIRVYQDFVKGKESQLASLGSNFSRFNASVLEPARVALIGQYVNDQGLGVSINGEVIVGEDQSSLARNTKHPTDSDVLQADDTQGAKNDLIFGESGMDTLQGGKGDDVLYGGTGRDIYRYRPEDGNDIIVDEDGKGVIVYDPEGAALGLAVGLRKPDGSANEWKSPDGSVTYTINGSDLTIQTPTGTLTVKDFNKDTNDLGIRLVNLPTEPGDGLAPITNVQTNADNTLTTIDNGVRSCNETLHPLAC